ncbi:secretagogin-like [Gouania willdenowi]|uniref:secretagogin-like n=1 Tax=Gouania willdenowi TaxID=441366 RepID=UPI0010542860|nr:secretagogin-like [Gouania willdenowi]
MQVRVTVNAQSGAGWDFTRFSSLGESAEDGADQRSGGGGRTAGAWEPTEVCTAGFRMLVSVGLCLLLCLCEFPRSALSQVLSPRRFRVKLVSPDKLHVSWKEPKGEFESYRVVYSTKPGGERRSVDVLKDEAKLLIEDVDPTQEYHFMISAVSGGQESKPLEGTHPAAQQSSSEATQSQKRQSGGTVEENNISEGNGSIEGNDLDDFLRHVLLKLGIKKEEESDDGIRKLRERIKTALDASADGRLHIQEIWRNYDTNGSGYISAKELKGFLQDLFVQHRKWIPPEKLDWYLQRMMEMFDKNRDGRLELNHLARILALKENFLLKFRTDASSQEDRRRDFEKIFTHYDVSQTGALEGPEVDGFVKDMMELVKPSLSGGGDLERFRKTLLAHCDINKDGKIQKNELALCLGLKLC